MPFITRLTIIMLFWVLLFVILTEFRNFLYPVFFGILFAYLFYPLANFFEKSRIPRILANILSILIGLTIIYGILIFIFRRLQEFMIDLPQMEKQAVSNITIIFETIENSLGLKTDAEESQMIVLVKKLVQTSSEGIKNTISATFNTVFSIFIIPVFIFFFLYYRNKFLEFIMKIIPDEHHDSAKKIIAEINQVTVKYMTGIFLVVLILCVINSIGLIIVGLKFAILWGIIAAIINFIPYFGTVIGYSIPFAVALLTGDSPRYAIGVLILFFIVQFSENNIITPNIVGNQVRINPMMIILGVLFGGLVWGIPGMFIVVPVLGMARIVCCHIPSLEPWALLMSDRGTEEYALNRTNIKKFFRFRK
ncbi:MAG: AI-2E family transporter [Desulfobacula sp.]|nr:AI-2E family transporter [Desulfobacula sp.]